MMNRFASCFVLGCVTSTVSAGAACAQNVDFQAFADVLIPDRSVIEVGAGPKFGPDYLGSNDYNLAFNPEVVVKFRYGQVGDSGVSFDLAPDLDFDIGPFIRIVGRRTEEQNEALTGLGDIGRSVELGGFIGVHLDDPGFSARGRYRADVANGHGGSLIDLQATQRLLRRGKFSTAASARITWVDRDYNSTVFGVSEEQSLASGQLDIFDPEGGMRDVRLGLSARYNITDNWVINGSASYGRLVQDAADSPIVDDFGSANQYRMALTLSRSFRFQLPGQ
ncbi:MAG: MipA/OmpV family protein [Pseudomonadota bacterium]